MQKKKKSQRADVLIEIARKMPSVKVQHRGVSFTLKCSKETFELYCLL